MPVALDGGEGLSQAVLVAGVGVVNEVLACHLDVVQVSLLLLLLPVQILNLVLYNGEVVS